LEDKVVGMVKKESNEKFVLLLHFRVGKKLKEHHPTDKKWRNSP
jgi:hypothetical protein